MFGLVSLLIGDVIGRFDVCGSFSLTSDRVRTSTTHELYNCVKSVLTPSPLTVPVATNYLDKGEGS